MSTAQFTVVVGSIHIDWVGKPDQPVADAVVRELTARGVNASADARTKQIEDGGYFGPGFSDRCGGSYDEWGGLWRKC